MHQLMSHYVLDDSGRQLDDAPDVNPDEGIWNYREAAWSWAMSVVPISISCIASSFKPKNACDTKRRSSKAAPESWDYML
jgi:hypothetical protein